MKKIIILFFAIATLALDAQDSSTVGQSRKIVALQPQYFINNGIRIDFDFKMRGQHWLQLCPQVYAADRSPSSLDSYYTLAGAGLAIYDKVFLQDYHVQSGFFLSYGVSYNYFMIKYLNHTTSGEEESKTLINKFGGDINLGYQLILFKKLDLDIYAGMGLRYSDHDFSGSGKARFNTSYIDFGYTGVIMNGGFRIGLLY